MTASNCNSFIISEQSTLLNTGSTSATSDGCIYTNLHCTREVPGGVPDLY
jgi:hypothetical protein